MLPYAVCYAKRLTLSVFFPLLLLAFTQAHSQIIVSGIISSSRGLPLDGASVSERGTSNGVITKSDGSFSLSVRDTAAILDISHVGYEKTFVAVSGQRQFRIGMTPAGNNNLTDVVVIGYGERRKKDVTGAVSTISSKEIEKSTAMSPELALQGTTAGVAVTSGGGDPNSRPIIRIRGTNTFGFADPLYVVDGVPIFEGGGDSRSGATGDIRGQINIFTLINPDDIESMSVLKDASSAAIYGVRASNGVILITTKKGRASKPRVDVSVYSGVQNFAKHIPVLTSSQFMNQVNTAYAANPDKDATSGAALPIGSSPNFGPLFDPASPKYAGNNPTTDWAKAETNKNAKIQNYNIRLSGGNDNTTYSLSTAYANTESPLKANNLNRYSISTNLNSRISNIFSAGMSMILAQENALVNTQQDLPHMINSIPFQPIYDPADPTGFAPVTQATFVKNPDYDPTKLSPGDPYSFATPPVLNYGKNTRSNVLAQQSLMNQTYQQYNGIGNVYLQVEPLKGLKVKATIGGQYNTNLRKSWTPIDAWRFSQSISNPYSNSDGNAKGTYGERQTRTSNLSKELTVDYNHTFGQHSLDVLLGATSQFQRWEWSDIGGKVNFSDPQYRQISNQPPFTSGQTGILQEDALQGYLGRVSYKYKDKYYLDGTIRRDGSSRLATGHKYDNFPSFAAAWRISQEDFFPKGTFVNDLKFRGGWGRLGNYQSALYYAFLSNVSLTPDYPVGSGNGDGLGQQLQGAALSNFANSFLTWENVTTTNFGFDASLFNDHLTFTAEYYDKTTHNIIQAVSLPPNTGIESPASLNVGSVKNNGMEFQLGYNTKLGQVDFNVSGNLTTVNNKVLKLNDGTAFSTGGGNYKVEQGYSLNYIYGYKVGGIFQNQSQIDTWRQSHADLTIGQSLTDPTAGTQYKPGNMYFQDVHGNPTAGSKEQYSPKPDSLVNSNDRTYLGKTIPGFTYGFSLGAAWKGFDLSVLFQAVADVQGFNSLRADIDNPASIGNMSTDVLRSWTPTNGSKTIPLAVYNDPTNPGRFSDRFVEQAGYLRLKNLTLGYSLPATLLGKTGFVKTIRLYASTLNLFTITKWTGLDPETDLLNYSNGDVLQGTPTTRQFIFGLRVSFN